MNMYTVAVKRHFVAQHYLLGDDWGEENRKHSHHYLVELQVKGSKLDKRGYLLNIIDIQSYLDEQVHYYKDKTLNDLPEFMGLNPSIECFAFILCKKFSQKINAPAANIIAVKIWESDNIWASYTFAKQDDYDAKFEL